MAARSPGPAGLLGVVSTLVGAAGCNDPCEGRSFAAPPEPAPPGPDSPPTIIAGEWIGAGILELQFSKPIASVGDLDPRRFSILAWDVRAYEASGACYDQTSYRALSVSYYVYPPPDPIAAAWIGPEDDTRLRLRMSNAASRCPTLPDSLASGVMLVYTSGEEATGPALLNADGDPIADIGPSWAVDGVESSLGEDFYFWPTLRRYDAGSLPNIDALVDIPCP